MSKLYLYAIAEANALEPDGKTGVKDTPIRTVDHEDLAAVVSPAPDGKMRPRRRNLKAHHDLLKALMTEATVLPMAFGVIADGGEGQIRSFLRHHYGTLRAQLDQVRGHAEVGLRVKWNVDDIFEHFVDQYDELRELRDAVFRGDGEPSRQEKIRVGEEFEAILQEARAAHRSTVEAHLDTACRAIEADDPKDETEVMNLACLVPKDGVAAFEEAVMSAAKEFSDAFTFTYTDPMAPYSFADVAFEEAHA
jgi:ElaB/YqjD/DUF883 family membrane-anchored ribosome-binding protein